VALISGFLVVESALDLIRGNSTTKPDVLAFLLLFFSVTLVAGLALVWSSARAAPVRPAPAPPAATSHPSSPEQRILRYAAAERGRVTVAEAAAHCDLDLEGAKRELDRLVVQDAASLEVTDDGVLVYVIRGFLSDDQKRAARDF
jgi:hypothetical protein